MVNPAGKAPSRGKASQLKNRTETLAKHRDALQKMHKGFSKLSKKQQLNLAVMKELQRMFPDEDDYSNKAIKNEMMSEMGVASGEYDEYRPIGKDSAGRNKVLADQKEKSPRGYALGGRIHRGRKAVYNV